MRSSGFSQKGRFNIFSRLGQVGYKKHLQSEGVFYYRLVWGKAPKPETKGPKLKDAFSFGRKDTLLTKHFTFLVGISGYLSLVKTEEHGTMAELSGKRERAIMTHHFLRKVSTCGSMEGRGTGTGSIWGRVRCREDGGGGLTGAHSRPRSSFRLPECPSCPGPG